MLLCAKGVRGFGVHYNARNASSRGGTAAPETRAWLARTSLVFGGQNVATTACCAHLHARLHLGAQAATVPQPPQQLKPHK